MKTIKHTFLALVLSVIGMSGSFAQQAKSQKPVADSTAAYTAFISDSKAKIKKNEASIDALKAKEDDRITEIKAKYDKQISALETKNKTLKQKVKDATPANWKTMQASMNEDMDSFEKFLIRNEADY